MRKRVGPIRASQPVRVVTRGACRFCGCTEETACRVAPYEEGDLCSWLSGTSHTVCTAASCLRQWSVAQARENRERELRETRWLRRWLLR